MSSTGKFSLLEFGKGSFGYEGRKSQFNWRYIGWQISGRIGNETMPDPLGVFGIYQNRKMRRGKLPVKMKFYAPTNPKTPAQQATREKFRNAMLAWHSLTPEQKEEYNKRAKPKQMFGRNLFIRDYYSSSS